MAWVIRSTSIDARRLGLGEGRLRPGPAVWAVLVAAVVAWPLYGARTPYNSSFAPYRMAGSWLDDHPESDGRLLDLTDWSLYFSGRNGDGFPRVLESAERPGTRFLLVREGHLRGHLHYNEVLRRRVADRSPVARFPERPGPRQLQVELYDLDAPPPGGVAVGADVRGTRLR
jgi:hypothetical protein